MANPLTPVFNQAILQNKRLGRPVDEFLRRVEEQTQPVEDDPGETIQVNFMSSWDDLEFPSTIEDFVNFATTQAIFTKAVEFGIIDREVTSIKFQVEGQSNRREMRKGNEEDFFQLLEDIETQRGDNEENNVSLIVIKVGPMDESTMMDKYAT